MVATIPLREWIHMTLSQREREIARAAPTEDQWKYVDGLRRKLHLTKALLENHAVSRFGRPLKQLDWGEVSVLINEMVGWVAIPGQLLREAGQLDLFGDGS